MQAANGFSSSSSTLSSRNGTRRTFDSERRERIDIDGVPFRTGR